MPLIDRSRCQLTEHIPRSDAGRRFGALHESDEHGEWQSEEFRVHVCRSNRWIVKVWHLCVWNFWALTRNLARLLMRC